MKLFREIWQDFRKRQNLDIYVTIFLAILVSVLGFFQVADQFIISSAVLTTLALVSFSLLSNRRENEEIQKVLSNLNSTEHSYAITEALAKVEELVSRSQVTVRYIEEKHREGVPFRGDIFSELVYLCDNTQKEILALVDADKLHSYPNIPFSNIHTRRETYWQALEKTLKRRMNSGFKYVRILQFPPGEVTDLNTQIQKYIGPSTGDHCKRVLEIRKKSNNPTTYIEIMGVSRQRMSSFMLFDHRYLTFQVNDIDYTGASYAVGLFIIEDKNGSLIDVFASYFEGAMGRAQPIPSTSFQELQTQE